MAESKRAERAYVRAQLRTLTEQQAPGPTPHGISPCDVAELYDPFLRGIVYGRYLEAGGTVAGQDLDFSARDEATARKWMRWVFDERANLRHRLSELDAEIFAETRAKAGVK